jgi:hypothetical protein
LEDWNADAYRREGIRGAKDERARYRRWETEIQEMGGRAVGGGRQRYRRWEVELQKMGDRGTGDGR